MLTFMIIHKPGLHQHNNNLADSLDKDQVVQLVIKFNRLENIWENSKVYIYLGPSFGGRPGTGPTGRFLVTQTKVIF